MEIGESSESPEGKKKSKSKTPRKPKDSVLKQKSPAEFFADNKNIAGFDNPGKCLYTTVRELVENALDSAESISKLPIVEITIEEIVRSKFNSMIGLAEHERVDEELYDDFESAKAREKRLAKEARIQEIQAKNANLGKKVKEPVASKAMRGRGETSYYRVTCKDNGKGMPHDDIPNMFGRVLSGTKYGLKQTRGKFGLGAKMALIWSKMSTGLPIEITSSMKGQNYTSFCRLDIDIHRNIPHIHVHEKQDKKERWHGAEIQIVIEGNWTTYRSKILHYMRQMAVITPYAEFLFRFLSDAPDKNVTVKFARRTDIMPPVPLETKYHPSAVDLLLIKRLIAETSKQNLLQFLQHEFVNISKSHAERLIGEMGPDFSHKMLVKSLTSQQIVRIHQLFRQAKFDDPSGDCLSPAGEYNLRLGIIKELHPDMVATYSGSGFATCSVLKYLKATPFLSKLESVLVEKMLSKYIPNVTGAIYDVLKEMSHLHASKRKRYANEDAEVLNKVSNHIITRETLGEKLAQHVEQVDYEMALEYATQSGVNEEPRENIYIQTLEGESKFVDFQSPVFVFRLFQ
ncbi:DNA topoisomerase 6 subunit B-like isoform X4 [Coffea arabica]|uniref:DNA topoisomerase 6 subunit B-like isoform X4 n=1 Tax=Coffea arabica TaxID=13443 RepID=A0ABM4V1J8_COFAR